MAHGDFSKERKAMHFLQERNKRKTEEKGKIIAVMLFDIKLPTELYHDRQERLVMQRP